jgi:hypothetical protein
MRIRYDLMHAGACGRKPKLNQVKKPGYTQVRRAQAGAVSSAG